MMAAVLKRTGLKGWRSALGALALVAAAGLPGMAQAQQAKPPAQPAPAPAPQAPAASSQAFGEADAGIYTVLDQKGQLTDIAYRFYLQGGKWVAEERGTDGGWAAFKCEKDCEITALTNEQVARLFGPEVPKVTARSCIGNNNFAACRYLFKNTPADAASVRFMMFVTSPKGIVAVPLAWTASL